MFRFVKPLLLLLAQAADSELRAMIEYLKAENRILRDKLPKRIPITATERRTLATLAKPLGNKIAELVTIVSPKTVLRWIDQDSKPKPDEPAEKKPGRPKTVTDTRELILRFAAENCWGYDRIVGELKKLGISVSRSTVRNILKEEGFDTGPKRGEGTWSDFIHRHSKTLWATDFFTKKILTMHGLVDAYVLFFIHIDTRRVFATSCTLSPDKAWVVQQARNFSIHLAENDVKASHLILDYDTKFVKEFDAILESDGTEMVRVGPRKPNMNAYAERWVQSIKREALDHFIAFGERHLDYLISEYVTHYNTERSHQSKDNLPLPEYDPDPPDILPFPTKPEPTKVECRERLGGKLKHYYRQAS